VEGSIQRSANRIRVNVQLIDAETEHHLWGERFDKPLVDLFDMQDEIVARLAHSLNAQLAISNSRLIRLADKGVTFKWKDYRFQGRDRLKTMTLDAAEFIRRFLLQVLPSGFHPAGG
jgi:hypothetical protein